MAGYRGINKLDKIIVAHKDKNVQTAKKNVVYKIECRDCNATYVSQTKRQLKRIRIKEHSNNVKLDLLKHFVISNIKTKI